MELGGLIVACGLLAIVILRLVFVVRAWRGRSLKARRWAGTSSEERQVTMISPGFLASIGFLLGWGVLGAPDSGPLFNVFMGGMVVSSAFAILGFVLTDIPSWWGPRWLREMPDSERVPDVGTPAGALQSFLRAGSDDPHATTLPVPAKQRAMDEVGMSDRSAISRGRMVLDDRRKGRDHGLGLVGAVAGWLAWTDEKLVFCSTDLESSVRGGVVDVAIDVSEIISVERSGRDGEGPKPRGLRRRRVPRVWVITSDSSHLFETYSASRIERELGSPRN